MDRSSRSAAASSLLSNGAEQHPARSSWSTLLSPALTRLDAAWTTGRFPRERRTEHERQKLRTPHNPGATRGPVNICHVYVASFQATIETLLK
ncbi:hypothetical protein [Micromonospora sp. IBSANI012]|uniref:hypothetical protein n=1 Tax=Micromonospora sp. IBSANI012 TaxID=3457761 RepID=UPI0040588D3C